MRNITTSNATNTTVSNNFISRTTNCLHEAMNLSYSIDEKFTKLSNSNITNPSKLLFLYEKILGDTRKTLDIFDKLDPRTLDTEIKTTIASLLTIENRILYETIEIKRIEFETSLNQADQALADYFNALNSAPMPDASSEHLDNIYQQTNTQLGDLNAILQSFKQAIEAKYETLTLRLQRENFKHALSNQNELYTAYLASANDAKEDTTAIPFGAVAEKIELRLALLEVLPLDAKLSDINSILANINSNLTEQFKVVLNEFSDLFDPKNNKKSTTEKYKILHSLDFICKALTANTNNLASVYGEENAFRPHRQQYRHLQSCFKELREILKLEIKHLHEAHSKDSFALLNDPEYLNRISSHPLCKQLLNASIDSAFIKTKLHNKKVVLVGIQDGNFFSAYNHKGEIVDFQLIKDDWVKVEAQIEESQSEYALAEMSIATESKEIINPPSSSHQTIKELEVQSRLLSKVQINIEDCAKKCKESEKSSHFSYSLALIKYQLNSQRSVINKATNLITSVRDQETIDTALSEVLEKIEEQIDSINQVSKKMKDGRVHAIKKSHKKLDVECLEFLLDENQKFTITQEKDKKPLAPRPAIGDYQQNPGFLDVFRIEFDGVKTPLSLHIHYGTEDGQLRDKTASHLKNDVEPIHEKIYLPTLLKLFKQQ